MTVWIVSRVGLRDWLIFFVADFHATPILGFEAVASPPDDFSAACITEKTTV